MFAGTLALWPGTRTPTDIKGPVFAAGTLVLALAVLAAMRRDSGGARTKEVAWLAAAGALYVAYTAASALWASHPWAVKYAVADRLMMLVLALAVSFAAAEAGCWKALAAGYVALGATVAVLSLAWPQPYSLWLSTPLNNLPAGEAFLRTIRDIKAPQGNANLLAAMLVLPGMLTAGFGLREWRGKRRAGIFVGLAAALALMSYVFVLCRGVSYWIAICAAVTVFVALRSGKAVRVLTVAAIVAAIAGGAAWKYGLAGRFKESKSYIVRAELWRRAAVMFGERPLAGWGAGNYWTDNQPFAGDEAQQIVHFWEGGAPKDEAVYRVLAPADANVHNEYLEEAAEGGILGLAAYLGLLGAAGASAFVARKRRFGEPELVDAGIAAFAAYLVAIAFNPELHFADFEPHFWILAGMLVAAKAATGGAERAQAVKRPLPWVVLAAAAVLAGYGFYAFVIEDYRSSIEYWKGERLYENGDYKGAPGPLLAAAEDTWDPLLRARALSYAGLALDKAGEATSAFAVYETLSGEIAALLDTDFRMGAMLERAGLYEKALFYYKRHWDGHREDKATQGRIALVEALLKLQQGRAGEGLLRGRDYLVDYPGDRAGRRAFVREALGPEIKYYTEMGIEADELAAPGAEAEDYALAGIIRFLQGDVAGAAPLLEKGKAGGYTGRDLFYFLARAYMKLGRMDEARKVAAQGRVIHPQCRGLASVAGELGLATREDIAQGTGNP